MTQTISGKIATSDLQSDSTCL